MAHIIKYTHIFLYVHICVYMTTYIFEARKEHIDHDIKPARRREFELLVKLDVERVQVRLEYIIYSTTKKYLKRNKVNPPRRRCRS